MRSRGFTLAELLVSTVVAGLLLTAVAALLAAQARLIRAHVDGGRAEEALRVTTLVAGAELAWLEPAADVEPLGERALALRALRGVATPCAADASGLSVRYRGLRQPEPAKDSVLVLTPWAPERALGLRWSLEAPEACEAQDGERVLRWTLDEEPPAEALLLLFERGSYHLQGGAFRYRRGAGGRQPLTEPVLDDGRSELRLLTSEGASTAEVVVEARVGSGPAIRRSARLRVPLLNGRPDDGR